MPSPSRKFSLNVSSRFRVFCQRTFCFWLVGFSFFFTSAASAQNQPKRPRILGIRHVRILVTNFEKSNEFYSSVLRPSKQSTQKPPCVWCEKPAQSPGGTFLFQQIELEPLSQNASKNLIAEIALFTEDAGKMRNYL